MMHVFLLQKSVTPATTKDGYTAEHAAEVARLSLMVGLDLGFNEVELEWLVHGALLHDLGKLGVADEILGKPGALTEEEWAAVKRHPQIGARMIEPIESLFGALPVVRHHHERPDGTGYPDGLEGEEIPLAARIVAAADAYDVMVQGRPYRGRRVRRPKRSRSSGAERDASSMGGWLRHLVECLGKRRATSPTKSVRRLLPPGRTPRCTLCPSSWPGRLSRELFTRVRGIGILRTSS
jgi:hypothetical protein